MKGSHIMGQNSDAVYVLNKHSCLPMEILTAYSASLENKLKAVCTEFVPNFMSMDFYFKGYTAIFSGYPNDESPFRLTDLNITSNKYSLYGIKIGNKIEKANEILLPHGYALLTEENSFKTYESGSIQICLAGNCIISEINISVQTLYLGNRIY